MLFVPMNEKHQMFSGMLDKKVIENVINDVLKIK